MRGALLFLAMAVWAPWASAAEVQAKEALFPLDAIRLTGGPLAAQQELNRAYLLRLEPDRLLSRFRREAGLAPKAEPYEGWENAQPLDLPGHILGFYMAGAAMTVEATGDAELRRRLLYIIDELALCQEAHGGGFVHAVKDARKIFAEFATGRIEVRANPRSEYCAFINNRFEPVYTLNKILLGIYRIYVATKSEKAKQVFLALVDWFGNEILEKLNDEQVQRLLVCEHGSLPESFADAYLLTGSAKHRTWARRLCHEHMVGPLSDGNIDKLDYHHANNEIPKFTGAERVWQICGDDYLHRAAVNAWYDFAGHRAWALGGNSHREHLFRTEEYEAKLLQDGGPESCNSVNLLRLAEAVFPAEPSSAVMDAYERVLFTHLLSTHEPERGRTAYYTPMLPGGYRIYSDEFRSTWCCTGTGFEAPGKYGQMVFTHAADESSVSVQLFAPATLNWRARGVRLSQSTHFPYGETAQVKVEAVGAAPTFTLKVRIPGWLDAASFSVRVNGEAKDVSRAPHGYLAVTRAWKAGDVVDISFPMTLRAERLPGSYRYVAFFYGPTLLAGELGQAGLKKADYIGLRNAAAWKPAEGLAIPSVPAEAVAHPERVLTRLGDRPLAFRLAGDEPVMLVPFADLHYQRYAVYWPVLTRADEAVRAAERRAEAALDRRTCDRVEVGVAASEEAHGFAGKETRWGYGAYGTRMEKRWRHAASGGFFAYRLKVGVGEAPRALAITIWGHELGARRCDILVDGTRIAELNLLTGPAVFETREFAIPSALLAGKQDVEVRFVPRPGNTAGGIFAVRLVRGP